ncbi:Cancer-related nucleoside-triphosphatase [Sesamum angolense]|uniref:Cancer-related nucleoside-triphosphatase n=1 Tax=Sesamum angolense TaxID=2727404 RepID=A0AAE2C5A4_9LAMI|nr:Cancer-related nucleoside-triphosphatase [Sesamum angolense]
MAAPGKCFLVTGPPGVGKTTLIIRVLEALKQWNPSLKIQGFYTRELREGAERVGFEVVTLDGRRGPLASTNISSRESQRWPNVGRYKVDVSSFESLALPELQFLESNIPLLASVPIPKSGRDIPGVDCKNHFLSVARKAKSITKLQNFHVGQLLCELMQEDNPRSISDYSGMIEPMKITQLKESV